MIVELRNINDIKPYPNNPRHNDHAVDAVAASIREFGFRQPIVVDEDGVIIVGETATRPPASWAWPTCPSTSPSA